MSLTHAEAVAATQALPELEVSAWGLEQLPVYDLTLPRDHCTAESRAGFRWRRWVGRDHCPSGWVLGSYGPADPDGNPIYWHRAVILNYSCGGVRHGALAGFGCRMLPQVDSRVVYEVWCDRMEADASVVGADWGALLLSLLRLPVRP